ncbi:TRAP transporter large permease [Hoeflea sp. WL0058]|uniref:TRAP transporter large permease protein n=1 Tax=Flavimaribacter sediminis TaxID=2865987 RepID=A0AAE2ZGG7_9HYPH|nr:TRAP transporter large permease [Flavimaribacter sediminis]MBW8636139.1 TRAP transporter large permease [Flavimaribacter sediminis]
MTPIEIGIVSVSVMLFLIYCGIHVPFVLALTSFVGVWMIRDNFQVAVYMLSQAATQSISDYVFAVIPLFVLMGMLVSAADLGRDSYYVANRLLRKLPGGLGIATVAANTVFASITGVTIASAAVFSRIAVPEMLRFGYHRRFAVGTVAGSSVLGMLIPPSILLIIYAIIAEQSVGAMFLAGIGPGLLLAVMFALGIALVAIFFPKAMGGNVREMIEGDSSLTLREFIEKMGPTLVLVIAVLGGIYGGVFTPTEAGGVGAALALVAALIKRKLTWRSLWSILIETGYISSSILFIVISATMYSRMLGISGLPTQISTLVSDLDASYLVILAIFVGIALILGTIIDSVSILLITVPLFIPLLQPYDINLVWFGIIAIMATEIGLLTPPFGMSCYVVRSTLTDYKVSLEDVFLGAAPFALIMLLVTIMLIAYPQIVLFFVY